MVKKVEYKGSFLTEYKKDIEGASKLLKRFSVDKELKESMVDALLYCSETAGDYYRDECESDKLTHYLLKIESKFEKSKRPLVWFCGFLSFKLIEQNKTNFNHVGVDIIVAGKPTVDKIFKIFASTSLNKKEKAVKILDLINKSVNKSLVFESKKITQTALDDKKRFKRLLFSSNINLDYVLKDNFFNEVFKDTIDKIIKQDIKKPDNNLIVERDLYNPYKLGELHFILQNKEAAKLALESMDLVKRKDKTVDVGYLYTKNLIDFIGGKLAVYTNVENL